MPEHIDNDETKNIARPFLILAHVRTGGTLLCHALSNHPAIFCARGEVMHHLSIWRRASIKPGRLMRLLWNQTGYYASGFRLIYGQAFDRRIWPFICQVQPRLIHLQRRSMLRQALSFAYQQLVRGQAVAYHPVHSFIEQAPPLATMDPALALHMVKRIADEGTWGRRKVEKEFGGPVLDVFYEDLVRGSAGRSANCLAQDETERMCGFLGVPARALSVDLKRDFPVPLWEMFANWATIRAVLVQAGYGPEVEEEEAAWMLVGDRWLLGES